MNLHILENKFRDWAGGVVAAAMLSGVMKEVATSELLELGGGGSFN